MLTLEFFIGKCNNAFIGNIPKEPVYKIFIKTMFAGILDYAAFGFYNPGFSSDSFCINKVGYLAGLVASNKLLKNGFYGLRLFLIDNQLLSFFVIVIAEWYPPTMPFTEASSLLHLIFSLFRGIFALKLGKREENIQHQLAHGVGTVELLGSRDECYVVGFKKIPKTIKILNTSDKPLNLVDYYYIQFTCFDIFNKTLNAGSFEVLAGETRVSICLNELPAFFLLDLDIMLTNVYLRLNRAVLACSLLIGGNSCINNAFNHNQNIPFINMSVNIIISEL